MSKLWLPDVPPECPRCESTRLQAEMFRDYDLKYRDKLYARIHELEAQLRTSPGAELLKQIHELIYESEFGICHDGEC